MYLPLYRSILKRYCGWKGTTKEGVHVTALLVKEWQDCDKWLTVFLSAKGGPRGYLWYPQGLFCKLHTTAGCCQSNQGPVQPNNKTLGALWLGHLSYSKACLIQSPACLISVSALDGAQEHTSLVLAQLKEVCFGMIWLLMHKQRYGTWGLINVIFLHN